MFTGYPYEWESGEDAEFVFWAPGEPNDIDGSQNCVRMYVFHTNGMWDDYHCHDATDHGFVCKTPQGSLKTCYSDNKRGQSVPLEMLLVTLNALLAE